jgi:hypothetical protein
MAIFWSFNWFFHILIKDLRCNFNTNIFTQGLRLSDIRGYLEAYALTQSIQLIFLGYAIRVIISPFSAKR